MSLRNYRTSKQVAEILGLSHVHIRYMITHKLIRAEKVGGRWVVSDREVNRLIESRQKNGESNVEGITE